MTDPGPPSPVDVIETQGGRVMAPWARVRQAPGHGVVASAERGRAIKDGPEARKICLLWTCARTESCSGAWLRLGVVRAS